MKEDNKRQLPSMIFAQNGRIATQFRGSRRELDNISNPFHSSAVDILGQKSHKHQDWFDENGEETRAGVCKTLCPQHLLVPKYGRICSVVIPQTNLDFAQMFNR